MNDAFIMHLRGPLQSYADTGFGQIREAGRFPSRSAVLGIVAGARGLSRLDTRIVALHQSLAVHIAIAREGEVRTDFHTVDAGAKNKTMTYRDYHHDAYFVALLEARTEQDEKLLTESRRWLRDPFYISYLGRRSCVPSVPLFPFDADGTNQIDALVKEVTHIRARFRKTQTHVRLYLDSYLPEATVKAMCQTARLVGYGERRDNLTEPRRSFSGRSFTEVLVSETEPKTFDPQRAYYNGAS